MNYKAIDLEAVMELYRRIDVVNTQQINPEVIKKIKSRITALEYDLGMNKTVLCIKRRSRGLPPNVKDSADSVLTTQKIEDLEWDESC